MIVYWHSATGEIMRHHRSPGAGWVVVADPAPDDFESAPYLVQGGQLVPDLATARSRQRAAVKAGRDQAMRGEVTVPQLGTFQLGGGGYEHLMGFFFRAKDAVRWGEAYSRAFKLADNSVPVFSASQWVTIGEYCEAELQARFARGEVLLARIAAAQTLAEIAAVTWSLEDPD